jgi:hypothetical protein
MAIANLSLRFVTELAGIGAVAYAAFQVGGAMPVRVVAAVGAAAALIIAWGLVVAPNTVNGLAQPQKDLIGTGLLLLAALALGIAGQPRVAAVFAVIVVANTALLFALGPGARETLAGIGR